MGGKAWKSNEESFLQQHGHMGIQHCANALGRSYSSVRLRLHQMSQPTNPESQYRMGKAAHGDGYKIAACPNMPTVASSWWKAGWHDADVEAGNSWL